jgi:hypothetical protein
MMDAQRRDVPILMLSALAALVPITLVLPIGNWRQEGGGFVWIAWLILFADLLAFAGIYRLSRSSSSVLLWLAFGVNFSLGMMTFFSVLGGSLLIAAALLAFAIMDARSRQGALFIWPGVLAQTVGFFGPFLVLLVLMSVSSWTTDRDRQDAATIRQDVPNRAPISAGGPS